MPVLWHSRPPDGILEGHTFTDGSSSGRGALRRAGWAVVAVDKVGNLKTAAYGAVPSDMLPGQTSRDGEDCAAAMAGHITLDPLTLHTDCEGTIATVNGPKCKALGAGGSRARIWSRVLVSHDEVRAVKVKGPAKKRDVEAGRTSHLLKRYADIFAKKRADTHKPAFRLAKTVVACAFRFRGWDDTWAAAPRPGARPPRARIKRKHKAEIAAPAQARCATGFHPYFFHASHKTVISTRASEGTACNWDEFSILGSGVRPNVERCTGNGRTRCAVAAAKFLVGALHSSAN